MMKTNHEKLKRITSFLTALGMSCSMIVSNGQAVFAYDSKAVATIINEDEHGSLSFAENNFEDVLIDVPIEPQVQYAFSIDEDGNIVQDEVDETLEDILEEQTETEEPLDSEDDSGGEIVDTESLEDESTEEIIEPIAESTEESAEPIQYTQIVDPNSKIISKGDTVIINATPEDGYSVESIYVLTDSGKAVTYSFNDNVISFTMPKNNVTIRATFTDTISDFITDDSVVDNYTYIKSNLNSDYVKLNKWELINFIKVKQTVVDKSMFDEYGKDVTIANMNSEDNDFALIPSIINFQSVFASIYDVDKNSDYYVAFVNTMQNDDSIVYDYCVAKNDNDGNVLTSNYYEKSTGLLYIKKDYINKIDVINDDSITNLASVQVQLLNAFEQAENNNHNINLIVNDDNNILDINTGIITKDQYDDTVSIKLSNNANFNKSDAINLKINEITIVDSINLSESSSNNAYNYDSDSSVLNIATPLVGTNSIEIEVINSDTTKNNIENNTIAKAAYYDVLLNDNVPANGPTWEFISGTLNNDTKGFVNISDRSFNYKRFYSSDLTNDTAIGYASPSVYALLNNIVYNQNTAVSFNYASSASEKLNNTWYTHKVKVSDIASITFDNGNTWNLHADNKINYVLLECADIASPITNSSTTFDPNSGNTSGKYTVYIKILDVNTSKNQILWAMVTSTANTQTGVGVFKSNYKVNKAAFTMRKEYTYAGLFSDENTKDVYNKAGTEYTLYDKDNQVVAILTSNDKGQFLASGVTVGDKYKDILKDAIIDENREYLSDDKDENGNRIKKVDTMAVIGKKGSELVLPNGNYRIEETKTSKGYNFSGEKSKNITLNSGVYELTNSADKTIRDYPASVGISVLKLDKLTGATNIVPNTQFELYYSSAPFTVDIVTDSNNRKATVNTKPSDGHTVTNIATFKLNNDCEWSISTNPVYIAGNNHAFPSVNSAGNGLNFCPLGYYVFIEVSAPDGHMLETVNDKPVYYTLDYPENKHPVAIQGHDNYDSINLVEGERKRWTYNKDTNNYTPEPITDVNVKHTWEVLNESLLLLDATKDIIRNYTFTSDELFEKFKETFKNISYTIKDARYEIKVGTVVIASGVTDENGKVIWTLTANGQNRNYYAFDVINGEVKYEDFTKGNTIGGFINNTIITITETSTSNGTAYTTKTKSYTFNKENISFNLESEFRDSTQTPFDNTPQTASIYAYKNKVELSEGNILHEGAVLRYVKSDDTGSLSKTIKEEDLIELENGEKVYAITAEDVERDPYINLYSVQNTEDADLYFLGTKLEIYYNSMIANQATIAGSGNWPTFTLNEDKTERILHNNSKAVRVGYVEYQKIDGKVQPVYVAEEFNVYNKNGEDTGKTYTGLVSGSYVKALPLGAYMVIETKCAESVKIIDSSTIQYKYISGYANSSTMQTYQTFAINNSSIASNTVDLTLNKITRTNLDVNLTGAEYLIYWAPESEDFDESKDIGKFSGDKYIKGDKFYLVGQYTVLKSNKDSEDKNADKNNYGVVSNSIFRSNGKYKWYTNGTDEYADEANTAQDALKELGIISDESDFNQAFLSKQQLNTFGYWYTDRIASEDYAQYRTFTGPKGHYVVVETKAPEGYNIDKTIHYNYLDGLATTNVEITSTEPCKQDPLHLNIIKKSSSNLEEIMPLEGTIYRLEFYEDSADVVYSADVKDIDENGNEIIKSQAITNPDELGKYNPDAIIYYRADANGLISIIDISYARGTNRTKYIKYNYTKLRYEYVFPSGVATLEEYTPASGYKMSSKDSFILNEKDFGNTMLIQFKEVQEDTGVNGEIVPTAVIQINLRYNKYQDWYKYQQNGEIVIDNEHIDKDITELSEKELEELKNGLSTAELTNDHVGYSFYFYKEDSNGNRMANVPFKLFMYKDDETEFKSWEFETNKNGYFHSANSDTFKDMNGLPLIVGKKYRIVELDNSTGTYLLDSGVFTYSRTTNIANLLNTKANGNTVVEFYPPEVGTRAWDSLTSLHVATIEDGKVKITDTVDISNLAVGNIYIIEGIAMDVTDPNNPKIATDVNGNYITASTIFRADAVNSSDKVISKSIDVKFEFAGTEEFFANKIINFHEYLALAEVTDKSTYDYGFNATDDKFNYVDGKVNAVTETIPENQDSIKCTSNLLEIKNGQVVLDGKGFIKTSDKAKYVSHADNTDKNQNIHFPTIKTLESDRSTLNHTSGKHTDYLGDTPFFVDYVYIKDTVIIKNLPAGSYRITYEVHDYESNAVLTRANRTISCDGSEEFTIDLDNISFYAGKIEKFYVTETLYSTNGYLIAQHTDKIDDQTGYIADIATFATNKIDNSKLVLEGTNATVIDEIEYKNFNTGDGYIAYGYLVDKETEEVIATANQEFTAKESRNIKQLPTVGVTFNFDTTGLDNKTLVVYEYVFNGKDEVTDYTINVGDTFSDKLISKSKANSRLVAKHYDNGDANQTIYIPHVHTSVTGETKTVLPIDNAVVEDIVYYDNVIANEDYIIYGFVIDTQGTDDESDDTIVTMNHTSFTAGETSGEAKMTFTFNAGKYYNKSLVVYEYLYAGKDTTINFTGKEGDKFNKNDIPNSGTGNGNSVRALVGKHEDSMDEKQTFEITGIHIELDKTDMNGKHLDGAVLGLYRLENNTRVETIAEWSTTDVTAKVFEDLEIGEYEFAELYAPEGYAKADSKFFSIIKEVDENGNSSLKAIYTNNATEELSYTISDEKGYKEYYIHIADAPLAELPTAGGSGELPIAACGIVMMLAGGLYIFKRKRYNS